MAGNNESLEFSAFRGCYLATWDGTGVVECGLGQDAAIQKQHVGSPGQIVPRRRSLCGPFWTCTSTAWSNVLMPVFYYSHIFPASVYQWLSQQGRRFACYKVHSDRYKTSSA